MKVIFLIVFLIPAHFFCISQAQNNQIKFNLVEGDNGKALGGINSITQGPHGYMWFSGTGANCLYRYDGTRMTAFRHDSLNPNSLSGATHMETVYADNAGMIWIGLFSNGDLDQYNPATGIFTHYKNDPRDPGPASAQDLVSAIAEGSPGQIMGRNRQTALTSWTKKPGHFIHYRNDTWE